MMELRPYQEEAIKAIFHEWNENDIRSTLLVLPTGCHAKGETLLMYNGSIKKVEDIKLDDEIMGPDGTGRTVLHIQEGNDELYKISPENVTPFVVTKDHKLTLVKTGKESELIDMTILDYLKLTDKKKEKLRLISAPAISDFHSFYSTLNLTVSPYQIGQSISDSFVPNEYKLNTKEVRLEFLKGLLDNKNAWSNKGCFYDTKSQKLAEDIVFLCKSLNINAFIKTDIKNSKTHYKVYITENSKILEKKCFDKFDTTGHLTYPFTVESVGKGDYIGFTVDKDNRYLLSDFLITHNCGKTIVFANVAKQAVESGKRVLILAHRGELLEQAQDKLKQAVDLDTELEKGTSHADKSAKVIVASVQTLYQDNRLLQYAPDEFDYIICDEAHHALSDTYKKIFEYFSSAKILGVTATPDRGDMKSLGEVFESKAYEYNMRDAIENGYLSPITVQTLPIKIDITDVGVQGGDFKAGELGTALDPYLEVIADRIVEKAFDRKIIIFLPLVATAQKMERILKEKGVSAIEVNGNSKNRKEILEDFSNNKYQVLLNSLLVTEGYDEPSVNCIVNLRATKSAGLYCLDTDTEILTENGWVKNANVGDKVAAFDKETGEIKYIPIISTIRRKLEPNEYFCSIKGPRYDIRVTNKHRMLYDNKKGTGWKFVEAEYLSSLKDGARIPVSGKGNFKGVPLTDDELKFIGWVMTDGCINKNTNAITISQSDTQPWFDEIEKCLQNCRLKYRKYINNSKTPFNRNGNNVAFYISKEKPRGTDKDKRGWGHLEKYISKDLSKELLDMTEEQFDTMLSAINLADGGKINNQSWTQRSYHIAKGNKIFIENLQIMAIQRGYKTSLSIYTKNRKTPLYVLHLKKQNYMYIGGTYDGRPIWTKENHTDEECWCVQNELGTLVTRRNGKVSIVGNCQIVGRGTRLFEGKTDLLILDFLWQTKRHDLFKPANLLCQNQEVAEQMTEIINDAEAPVDLMQAEEVAAEDIRRKKEEEIRKREEALLKRLYESQERQKQQAAHKGQFRSVIFREQSENPNIEYYYDDNNNLDSMVVYNDILFFLSTPTNDLTRFEPNFVWEMKPMTDKQKEVLSSNGVDPELIQFKGFASKIIDVLFKRREDKLCTIKQGLFLKKRRFKNTNMWTFEQASKMMTLISKCHWQVPKNIDPETYNPFKTTRTMEGGTYED